MLSLNFLLCKMEIILSPVSQDCCEIIYDTQQEAQSSVSLRFLLPLLLPKIWPKTSAVSDLLLPPIPIWREVSLG